MLISEVQFQRFIEGYLGKLSQLTSEFSQKNKQKIFPHILIKPHKIVGIISNVHGLAIEFVEESSRWSLGILKVDQRIENVVLPQKSTKNIAFAVSGRNVSFGRMGIYTKEFFEKYVEKAEGTILKLEPPLEAFAQISVGGDVFFYDIQFGAVLDGKPSVKTVKGGLWIFGSNSAEDFTLERAQKRAIEVFNWYLSLAILRMPRFPEPPERTLTLRTLSEKIEEFQVLISKPKLKERELQKFFEKNPEFLFGTKYRKLFSQILLKRTRGKDLRPDFLLERVTDGFCDILDIKLPKKKILRGKAERRRFTNEVYEAIAQVREYREYFNDPKHKKWIKKKYRLSVYKPHITVLIGLGKNIEKEDLIKIRDQHPFVEVITYNDILKQIVYLKDLLEKFGIGFKRR